MSAWLFYQGSRLHSRRGGAWEATILRAEGAACAEVRPRLGMRLLATDVVGSIITVMAAGPINYTVYGHAPSDRHLASVLGFTGELHDGLLQAYHLGNGNRTYHPALQRFLSPDPTSPFDDGGINSYGYCSGDPVNYSDPTGFMPKKTHPMTSMPTQPKRRIAHVPKAHPPTAKPARSGPAQPAKRVAEPSNGSRTSTPLDKRPRTAPGGSASTQGPSRATSEQGDSAGALAINALLKHGVQTGDSTDQRNYQALLTGLSEQERGRAVSMLERTLTRLKAESVDRNRQVRTDENPVTGSVPRR